MCDNWLLVVGNIVDGLKFIGPFVDPDCALEYASDHLTDEEYVVVGLTVPFDEDEEEDEEEG